MAPLGTTISHLNRNRHNLQKLTRLALEARDFGPVVDSPLAEVTAFGRNPGNLRMFAYAPGTLPAGAPLVVVLHGCTQNARGYDRGAGWSVLAERYGFALLMPQQRKGNNHGRCFNWFEPNDTRRDRGEALSIRQMIAAMAATHDIDEGRIFVTGLSAGGAMAAAMLATYPELFAAGAIVAGLPYGAAGNLSQALDAMFQGASATPREWGERVRGASPHRGPWPRVAVWHGTADRTVSPTNAAALVEQWRDVHGLDEAPREETVEGALRRSWSDAGGTVRVEEFSIPGLGHGTPIASGAGEGRVGVAGPFLLEAGISSTHHIADFFGLTGEVRKPGRRRTEAPRPFGEREPRPATALDLGPLLGKALGPAGAAPSAPIDVGAVIHRALKAAGLMK